VTGHELVGPVLEPGATTSLLLIAIALENPGCEIVDRGGYVRVRVPRRCVLTRAAAERALRGPFRLPRDLEAIMPAFAGELHVDEERAVWQSEVGERGAL
jgi:hypothetical protein